MDVGELADEIEVDSLVVEHAYCSLDLASALSIGQALQCLDVVEVLVGAITQLHVIVARVEVKCRLDAVDR